MFVLTQTKFELLECPRAGDVTGAISGLQQALTSAGLRELGEDIGPFKVNAGKLYDALLAQPLALLDPHIRRLTIIPDGPLCEVPFELLGKAGQQENFYSFPYLLRKFTISYASSSQLFLKQCETARTYSPQAKLLPFVGFAPIYSDADTLIAQSSAARTRQARLGRYGDLPEARREVQEIAGLLGGQALLGEAARERSFKTLAPQARVVHLSMHAILEPRDPLFSRLLFSVDPDAPAQHNELYALEIYALYLPARLVVLSACETGVGVLQRGEGVMSLARAFAHTGTPTLIMSLWPVEDKSTRVVMVDFYRQALGGRSTDEALRQAKLQYLANCHPAKASPYYWAGFVATGAMSPVFKQ